MVIARSAISALVPIKDGALHISNLREQLNKTLLPHDEIILVNDGSVDQTSELLRNWSREDSRIQVLSNDNHGIANALNLGLNSASNIWVARFDVDDIYREDRIEKQLKEVSIDTVTVFSDYSFRSVTGKRLGVVPSAVFPPATSVSLFSSQRTPHPVSLINREAVISVGGYRQEDFPAEDLSLWLRLSRVGKLLTSPHELLSYTINPMGVSSTKRNAQLAKKAELLTSIGINPSDYNDVTNDLLQICRRYESYDQTSIRKWLLCRELHLISESQFKDFSYPKMLHLHGVKTEDMVDVTKFAFSTMHRRLLRFSV